MKATRKAASRPGLALGEGVLVDRQWLEAHLLDPPVRLRAPGERAI